MTPRPRALVPLALAGALLTTGCSFSAGTGGAVSEEQVEEQVMDGLEAEVGQRPDAVDCPEDLEAEVGTEMRCTLTAGEDELGVTVTVTAVDGDDVNFDFAVDEQ